MLALTQNLYIADDVKWSFIDAIMNKRIKEALFWIVEYYNSGYKQETWKLLFVVYDCFYFTQNSYYAEKMHNFYKKWCNNQNLKIILKIVYKFYKIQKFDFIFFNMIIKKCKCKKVNGIVDSKFRNEVKINKKNLFNKLILSLQSGHFRNVWFFINYNLDKTLQIIQCFYKSNINFKNTKIQDIKMQIMQYVYNQNMKHKKKKKHFTIKIPKMLENYLQLLLTPYDGNPRFKLKKCRLYEIPNSIGCFYLERNKYSIKEIRNNYFYNWECCANKSKYWKSIFEHWAIEFDENHNPIFINDEIQERFYEKYNLEPDEQSIETHNKSIKEIECYDVKEWINSFKK